MVDKGVESMILLGIVETHLTANINKLNYGSHHHISIHRNCHRHRHQRVDWSIISYDSKNLIRLKLKNLIVFCVQLTWPRALFSSKKFRSNFNNFV